MSTFESAIDDSFDPVPQPLQDKESEDDDLFDNGTMRSDYDQAAATMDMLITSFDDSHKPQPEHDLHTKNVSVTKLADFHGSIWNSIKSSAPPGNR